MPPMPYYEYAGENPVIIGAVAILCPKSGVKNPKDSVNLVDLNL